MPKTVKIELSDDELSVLLNYITRKCYKLEEANLTDSYCYPRLHSVEYKLTKAQSEIRKSENDLV